MSQITLQFPPGVQAAIQGTLDSIMNNIEGRTCILYYPPLQVPISGVASLNAPVGSDFSSNIWAGGSPLPIHAQQSYNPYADGTAYMQVEQTGIITMVIYPNPQRFKDIFPAGYRLQAGSIATRGYVKDIPAVVNCVKMRTYVEAGTANYDYKLAGEPVMPGTIIPTRYFYAIFDRI